ncbi:hypothetical protein ACFV0R_32885, partial [Streptomyces sp. NPDC059578]|uniref:hypothetical protein n=1 Tax=Streptomyces sp. NPDC059578 TaxID=3346874 RepID=UPI0036A1F478
MRDETPANSTAPGDGLVRAGAIVFFFGATATLVSVAPRVHRPTPVPTDMLWLWLLIGVGLANAGAG